MNDPVHTDPPKRRRWSFVFFTIAFLLLLPVGVIAVVSEMVRFEVPPEIDKYYGPAMLGLIVSGFACIVIRARMFRMER